MPNPAPTQDNTLFSEPQENKIQQLVCSEIKKASVQSHKNTTIIVTTCVIISIMIVVFSMFYMAQLKQNLIFEIENTVKNHDISNSNASSINTPSDTKFERTITVQLESSNLLSSDYLAIVLPVLISLSGAYIVFLGMNRLKMFDDRIDSTRSGLLNELNTMVSNQVTAQHSKTTTHIQSLIDNLENHSFKIEQHLAEKEKEITNAIEHVGMQYQWLKEFESMLTDGIDIQNILSVSDAHSMIEYLYENKPDDYYYMTSTIISHVINDRVPGDSADFHNLATALVRQSRYDKACSVIKRALALFPNEMYLVADLLFYASISGDIPIANEALSKLVGTDRRLWTWQCYAYSIDFYKAVGDLDQAHKLSMEYITAMPTDERGYRMQAEIERLITSGMDGINKSISILESALNTGINCVQCANLLGETYLELGKYQEALSAFDRAIQELAQEQANINPSEVFYHRALCFDRMFMESVRNHNQDDTLAINAYTDYSTACRLGRLPKTTESQASMRNDILSRYLPRNAAIE